MADMGPAVSADMFEWPRARTNLDVWYAWAFCEWLRALMCGGEKEETLDGVCERAGLTPPGAASLRA